MATPPPPPRSATAHGGPRATHVDYDDLQMETPRQRAESFAAARDRILVRACLLELKDADRELLELCLFHGWSTDEVGQYLGICQVEVAARVAEQCQRLEHRHGMVSAAAAAAACWQPAGPAAPAGRGPWQTVRSA